MSKIKKDRNVFTCGVSSARVILLKLRLLSYVYLYFMRTVFCPHFYFNFILIMLWRCFAISKRDIQINEDIRDNELRIISASGEQLGIMSAEKALDLAAREDLDLVKIAPQAKPPVCKIMDYGKYKFEQAKREKEARKNQKIVDIKEVRLSLNIDTHDFNTKLNNAIKFIKHGDKVKVSIRFRGREMGHAEFGYDLMNRFSEACSEYAVVNKPAKLEGRNMLMFLSPKPNK